MDDFETLLDKAQLGERMWQIDYMYSLLISRKVIKNFLSTLKNE